MEIQIEAPKSYSREIKISVPADEVDRRFDDLVSEVRSKATISGFRQGKAPRGMIINNFGDSITADLSEELIKEGYSKALQDHDFKPMTPPRIESDIQFERGQDFSVTILIEVRPEVELKQYEELALRKKVESVSDGDIEKGMTDLRKRSGRLQPVEDRASQVGDLVLVDFKLSGEEDPAKRVFELDETATVSAIGHKPGEVFEGHFEFPGDFPDQELAGKICDAEVTIIELKEMILAEIDEDFLSQFGEEIDTEEALRQKIRTELEGAREQMANNAMRDQARDELIRLNPLEISPLVIDAAVEDTIKRYWDISNLSEKQLSEIQVKIRPKIEADFAVDFILDKIASTNEIEVSRNEIKEHVAQIARANNIDAEAYYRYLRRDGDIKSIEADIIAHKAMDIVIEKARIIEE